MTSTVFSDSLEEVEESVDSLWQHVAFLQTAVESLDTMQESLSALDYAQLHVSMAFAMTTLYYAYLRTRGINHEEHPLNQDLTRLKLYMKKVIQKVQHTQSGDAVDNQDAHARVDKKVAERIVRFYTKEQS